MMNTLLLLLAVTLSGFSSLPLKAMQENIAAGGSVSEIPPINPPLNEIATLLHAQKPALSEPVITKVLTTLKCASRFHIDRNNILTIIDYSRPSNEKRIWIFDLDQRKLLYHTYVSHGIKSGSLLTDYFSNKHDSKASSLGVYRTEKAYYGREGLSLRLEGLDRSFNDNAFNRSIVMHGGWYVTEQFIKKYGRPGRSWGCPAVPPEMYQSIINTIKDSSLFVVYYPDENWFGKSKFLNCNKVNTVQSTNIAPMEAKSSPGDSQPREDVLFAAVTKGGEEPIVVMAANQYEKIFHNQAPLARMLRRQINKEEYVALSNSEFHQLVVQNNREGLDSVAFVIPVLHMVRGYYETQMKIINWGKIKDIRLNNGLTSTMSGLTKSYTVNLEAKPALYLKATNRFIRWLGL